MPREIVSPCVIEVIIQDGREQADLERPTRLEVLDNLPGTEVLLVGVTAQPLAHGGGSLEKPGGGLDA